MRGSSHTRYVLNGTNESTSQNAPIQIPVASFRVQEILSTSEIWSFECQAFLNGIRSTQPTETGAFLEIFQGFFTSLTGVNYYSIGT